MRKAPGGGWSFKHVLCEQKGGPKPEKKTPTLGLILNRDSWRRLDPLFLCIQCIQFIPYGLLSTPLMEDIHIYFIYIYIYIYIYVRISVMLFLSKFYFLHFRLSAQLHVHANERSSPLCHAPHKCEYCLFCILNIVDMYISTL